METKQLAFAAALAAALSFGAALVAALVLAREVDAATIVTILPDRGEKYLSTALFQV